MHNAAREDRQRVARNVYGEKACRYRADRTHTRGLEILAATREKEKERERERERDRERAFLL